MAKYDGWIAKDKYGDFWYGTFGLRKTDAESHIKGEWSKAYEFKIVKVKFVEVEKKEEEVQCPACGRWISIKATGCVCQLEEEE